MPIESIPPETNFFIKVEKMLSTVKFLRLAPGLIVVKKYQVGMPTE